jgi:hypothetical protein
MTKPSITIYDHATGETVVREMNEIEYAEHLEITQSAQASRATREAEELAKELAKTEAINKLRELGIDPLAFGLQAEQSTPSVTNGD